MQRCGTLTWVGDTRTTTGVASVPNRQRDLLSVGNVKRQHSWHWCRWQAGTPGVEGCCGTIAAGDRVLTEGGSEKTDSELLSKISQNTQKTSFENLSYAPSSLPLYKWGTVKFVACVNSFVLTAGEAWGSRSLPSKGSPCNRDGRIIYMKR